MKILFSLSWSFHINQEYQHVFLGLAVPGGRVDHEYQPIYSQKQMNFKILKIEIENKNKINLEIKNNLNKYKNIKSSNEIELKIDSQKNITTISKDANGNPKKFEMEIIVSLNVLQNENLKPAKPKAKTVV